MARGSLARRLTAPAKPGARGSREEKRRPGRDRSPRRKERRGRRRRGGLMRAACRSRGRSASPPTDRRPARCAAHPYGIWTGKRAYLISPEGRPRPMKGEAASCRLIVAADVSRAPRRLNGRRRGRLGGLVRATGSDRPAWPASGIDRLPRSSPPATLDCPRICVGGDLDVAADRPSATGVGGLEQAAAQASFRKPDFFRCGREAGAYPSSLG